MTSWTHLTREQQIAQIEKDWAENPRWKGIKRGYSAADVVRLRGSLAIEHTLAKRGAEKLWNLINTEPFINALGALTGNQAMQKIVFNGHYLMYFDTAVAAYWRALAMPYAQTMERLGGDLYVRKATVEYLASARYDDLLDVGMRRCSRRCGPTRPRRCTSSRAAMAAANSARRWPITIAR